MADLTFEVRLDGAGDYTSLNAALTTEETDLTTAEDTHTFEITGAWGTLEEGQINSNGYTTNPTYYLKVIALGTARHNGFWTEGAYAVGSGSTGHSLIISGDHTEVHNLQFTHDQTAVAQRAAMVFSNAGGGIIDGCIIRKRNDCDGEAFGIYLWPSAGNTKCVVSNNIIYGYNNSTAPNSAMFVHCTGSDANSVYNNTIFDCYRGMMSYPEKGVIVNNVFASCKIPTAAVLFSDGTNYNATDTLSIGYTNTPTNDVVGATIIFASILDKDFHIRPCPMVDTGLDLSDDSRYAFSNDIDGATRSGNWDRGADEWLTDLVFSVRLDGSGDYTALHTAMVTELKDLTGSLQTHTFDITGAWGTAEGGVSVTGYTTNPTYFFTVRCLGTSLHTGKWTPGAFIAGTNYNSNSVTFYSTNYCEVYGLQIRMDNDDASSRGGLVLGNNGGGIIENCIVKKTGASVSGSEGIYVWPDPGGGGTGTTYARVVNNIVYDFIGGVTDVGILAASIADGGSYVLNNTIFNCGIGIRAFNQDCIAINNVLASCLNPAADYSFSTDSDYNITSSVSMGYNQTPPANDILSAPIVFASIGGEDFRLRPSAIASIGIDTGFNLSAYPTYSFSDTITGSIRGTVWDRGAHEWTKNIIFSIRNDGSGDYTTLAAGVNTEAKDITASLQSHTYEITGTWPEAEGGIYDAAYHASPTYFLKFVALGSSRHTGKWTDSAYACGSAASNGFKFGDPGWIYVYGLQVMLESGSTGARYGIEIQNNAGGVIDGCIVKLELDPGGAKYGMIIYPAGGGTFFNITNSVVYGFKNEDPIAGGIYAGSGSGKPGAAYISNTTFYNCHQGLFVGTDDVILRNCVFASVKIPARTGYHFQYASNNATDTLAMGYTNTGTEDILSATLVFASILDRDFHLMDGSDCIGAGTVLAAAPTIAFTNDIDGQTRVAPWDIGADAYFAILGGGTISIVSQLIWDTIGYQLIYPTSTVGAGDWLPSDTTLAGDTSDQNITTYAYLDDAASGSAMTLNFQQHTRPYSNSPGATLTITWQQTEGG